MARLARNQLADGSFHVAARGNRRQVIFLDDGDRRFFLALLHRIVRKDRWALLGYCLLDTHYHLLVECTVAQLSQGMHRLNGSYAQGFNARHGYDGHLFQGRFYSGPVEADGHLLEIIRYVALNPVRSGVCSHPASWPWSSYAGLVGWKRAQSFVSNDRILRLFSPDKATARQLILRFVDDRG